MEQIKKLLKIASEITEIDKNSEWDLEQYLDKELEEEELKNIAAAQKVNFLDIKKD